MALPRENPARGNAPRFGKLFFIGTLSKIDKRPIVPQEPSQRLAALLATIDRPPLGRIYAHRDGFTSFTDDALVSVYNGQRCLGHLLERRYGSYQAIDADDGDLGRFSHHAAARQAVMPATRRAS